VWLLPPTKPGRSAAQEGAQQGFSLENRRAAEISEDIWSLLSLRMKARSCELSDCPSQYGTC
jgi:hypothetical protein